MATPHLLRDGEEETLITISFLAPYLPPAPPPLYRRSRFCTISPDAAPDFFTWLPGDIWLRPTAWRPPPWATAPFLDHRLVEMASQIPPHYRIRRKDTKYILRGGHRLLAAADRFSPQVKFPTSPPPLDSLPFYHRLQELFTSPTAAHYFNSLPAGDVAATGRAGCL